ncbi:MAG: sigma-54 dependent transcriptional regulator [Tannerella sp.]|jgi:transcriptional regulator with PAS, ATPase and Fis domain|nr:sigma-54 dependent transcriptional regulator [Tannerella sp.]
MENSVIQQVKQRFGIIGTNTELNRAIDVALQVAPTDLSVLITGESGVGKESFPQIIHQYSPRKHSQYIAVNCGAIPEGTIDSELFGHEKGSFTDAKELRKGYFEVANGGTIFLDEVGELPLSTQVRLLRVLESGEFIKVGSSKVQKTDVRIVAATNVDLVDAVMQHRFREDLFYRLSTVPIRIPPLRERHEDVLLLFRKFASDCAEKYRMPPISLTDDAKQLMMSYRWPGNVRELKNIVERISVIESVREITADVLRTHLPNISMEKLPVLARHDNEAPLLNSEREILYQLLFDMKKDMNDLKKLVHDIMNGSLPINEVDGRVYNPVQTHPTTIHQPATHPSPMRQSPVHQSSIQEAETVEESLSLEESEKEMIHKALERHSGRRRSAAADLQISERTLYRKIKEYGLE